MSRDKRVANDEDGATGTAPWWDGKGAAENTLARYDAVRARISELMTSDVSKRFNKTEMNQAGRDLGLLRRGVLCFDSEEHMTILIDYLHMFSRLYGTTPCERYLKTVDRTDEDETTRAAHDALASARYAFLTLEEPRPGFGYVCYDVLRGERVFLVDRSMSRTEPNKLSLATGVFAIDDWVMTTGSALPFGAASAASATEIVQSVFQDLSIPFRVPVRLSKKDETRLVRTFIRAVTNSGALDIIRYEYNGHS